MHELPPTQLRLFSFTPIVTVLAPVFFLTCSSVQELPPKTRSVSLPNLKFLDPGVVRAAGDQDYKRKERSRPGVRLVVPPGPTGGEKLSVSLRRMVFDGALSGLRLRDVVFVKPDSPEALADFPGPRSLAVLKTLDADAVVSVAIETFDDDKGGAEIILRDPVDGQILGRRRTLFSLEARDARSSGGQVDYHLEGSSMRAIRDRTSVAVRLELPPESAMRQLVDRTVTGMLSVLATAPGASVFVRTAGNRRSVGRAPIEGIRLQEGRSIVEVVRRGYEPFVREVLIRAGRVARVQAVWPGDSQVSSLTVLSVPVGLRLALDGVIRAETPAFLTELQEGAYGLELSRAGPEGGFIVQADGRVHVGNGDNDKVAFFVAYDEVFSGALLDSGLWQLAAEDGTVKYTPAGGLGLSGTGTPTAWRGLASIPVLPGDISLQLDAVQAGETQLSFALVGQDESVTVELVDGNWSVTRFRGRDASAPVRDFRALREGNAHRIEYDYSKRSSTLTVRLDGSVLFQGRWNPGAAMRIALLTRGPSADGRPLATKLRIRSGRGLVEE